MKVDARKDRTLVVTAGPTREKIDPVRFISNYSSGTLGYEIARAGAKRGYKVVLISGPTALTPPKGVRFIGVESATDMKSAVLKEFKKADCLIMAAAVSDWRVKDISKRKIKRSGTGTVLRLVENPDILKNVKKVKGKKVVAGFALETEDLRRNAVKKMAEKGMDFVVANKLDGIKTVFGPGRFDYTLLDKTGSVRLVKNVTKKEAAKIILDKAFDGNL